MPDWDDIFTEKGRVFLEPHPDMERISQLLKEREAKRILDLGCGTGRHLVYLAKLGFEMYGFDASPKALSITKEWLVQENLRAKLTLHRMENIFPYEANFFDAIISIQVLHHNFLKDILFSVKEIERILKPRGIIYITFPKLGTGLKLDKWELKKVENNTYVPQAGPEKGLPHHFFTLDEINQVFNNFNLLKIYMDKTNHRAILGVLK